MSMALKIALARRHIDHCRQQLHNPATPESAKAEWRTSLYHAQKLLRDLLWTAEGQRHLQAELAQEKRQRKQSPAVLHVPF
jgi:hypothetical protein